MPDDRSKLIISLRNIENANKNTDFAAGHSKGISRILVENLNFPIHRLIRLRQLRHNIAHHTVYVGEQSDVTADRNLSAHFLKLGSRDVLNVAARNTR